MKLNPINFSKPSEPSPQQILSDITVHMKYAKYLPEKERRETWEELVTRNKKMHIENFPELKKEIEEAYKFVYDKKVLPSMRSLQFSGKPIEISPSRIYNCAYLPIDSHLAFNEIMFLLLGGTGVGFSVQQHHVDKLPPVLGNIPLEGKERPKRYLIGDSIEGWSDSIKVLVDSWFKGKKPIEFDYRDIRAKGERLITSGGKAPGPAPLRECITKITNIFENVVAERGRGTKLKPIEVHDIVCHIADAVLAGGIRRAALISLFSFGDMEMLTCKSGMWWEANPQRGRANNSVVLVRDKVSRIDFFDIWKKVEESGAGEPGFFFTNDKDLGTNPCCFTGDTKLKTAKGNMPIRNLADEGIVKLINKDGEEVDGKAWSNGVKSIVTIKAGHSRNPKIIKCTEDHVFMTKEGEEKEAKDLLGFSLKPFGNTDEDLTVFSVQDAGEEEVFDFTLYDDTHWGVVEGVIAHNCEISLKPFQMCNLTEINASTIQDQQDMDERSRVGSFIGTLQAAYTNFHYLRSIWQKTVEKDALIGVSMTGVASEGVMALDFTKAAEIVKDENARVAEILGINKASRTTCNKPSGTTSLVLGTSSGIHAWHNDYYIRRIRVGKAEAIYKYLVQNHPELIEDEKFDPVNTAVISIPQKAPEGALLRTEPPIATLERVKKLHTDWIKPGHRKGKNTHNVSCTISVKKDEYINEWVEVGEWMWGNRDIYSGIAVLPYNGGTYAQAPFEDITEEQYTEMVQHLNKVDLTKIIETDDNTDLSGELACAGGACEIT